MPKPAKDVAIGLDKKGFARREGDHSFFHLYVGGKKTPIYTKISHGEKEIHDALLGTMARQVRLTRMQFLDLIECPLSFDEYLKLLRANGEIEPAPAAKQ